MSREPNPETEIKYIADYDLKQANTRELADLLTYNGPRRVSIASAKRWARATGCAFTLLDPETGLSMCYVNPAGNVLG